MPPFRTFPGTDPSCAVFLLSLIHISARLAELNAALNIDEKRKEPMEKRPMKDVLKAYQERADARSQGEKGGTNEWNR